MVIGDRLRALREAKKLSQGDIQKRSGLLRHYVSRLENGHTIPSVETLEKLARALRVPLYRLFYEGEEPPKLPRLPEGLTAEEMVFGARGKQGRFWAKLRSLVGRLSESDRALIMDLARRMAKDSRA